jgi:hypothetical protein
MDSAKLKKLQDYSVVLTEQAESKEASGNTSEAIKDYVKLVDVLLLLANEAKDHPSWQQLIGRAEYYQKKARAMADPNSPSPPSSATNLALRKSPPIYDAGQTQSMPSETKEKGTEGSSSVLKSFRKLSFMGNGGKKPDSPVASSVVSNGTSWTKDSKPAISQPVHSLSNTSGSQVVALQTQGKDSAEPQKMIPFSIYAQVLHEKSALQEEVKTLQTKEKEYLETLEAKERQLEETLSNMVPKTEFDQVCSRLENSVPREEYEQALVTASIPKERYAELQGRVMELEMKLQNSVPAALVDEISEYVSFLVSTVVGTEQKGQTPGTTVAVSGS